MTSIVTNKFKVTNARLFCESLNSTNHTFYVFIGKTTPWDSGFSDLNYPQPKDTDKEITRDDWVDMIAAKRITTNNARMAIRRYDWKIGVVYDTYSATEVDMHRKAFYVMNNSNVYKCISNGASTNNGIPLASMTPPTGTGRDLIVAPDGYVWKYMFTVSGSDGENFMTPTYIPVPYTTILSNSITVPNSINPINTNSLGDVLEGHGTDIAQELYANYVIINGKFSKGEGGKINTVNDYRKVGILIDPRERQGILADKAIYDQTTRLNLTAQVGTFELDDEVLVNGTVKAFVVDKGVSGGTAWISVTGNLSDIPFPGTVVSKSNTVTASIASIANYSELARYSGVIGFIEHRTPIIRSPDQIENLNIVLEF